METVARNQSGFNLTVFPLDSSPVVHPYVITARLLWKYFPPFLILLGTFGNIMTVVILCRKAMWKMAFSPYLVVLSFADILVLYTGLLRQWVRALTGIDVRESSPTACKLHVFSVYTFVDFSVWILVAVSVERFIGICFPFKAKTICTRRRTQVTLLIIFFVLVVFNSHFFHGMGSVYDNSTGEAILVSNCHYLYKDYQTFSAEVWPWMDLCVFSLVPSCVIVFCNVSLLVKVMQPTRRNLIAPSELATTQRAKSSSMTALLLSLNALFLTSTAPISIYLIGFSSWAEGADSDGIAKLQLWWAIVNMLMYMNNSVNFILYCVSGPRFRKEIKHICQRQNKVGVTISVTPSQLAPAPMELSPGATRVSSSKLAPQIENAHISELVTSNLSPNSEFLAPAQRKVTLTPRPASVSSLRRLPDVVTEH